MFDSDRPGSVFAAVSPDGSSSEAHDTDITEDTIVPAWYGDRLDLD